MKGVTLEGVAAINVIGAALKPLTERGVIGPDEYPLCRFLYSVVAEDAPLDMPWGEVLRRSEVVSGTRLRREATTYWRPLLNNDSMIE